MPSLPLIGRRTVDKEQLEKLIEWIDARIDYKVEAESGRDPINEYIKEDAIKRELLAMFGEE